MILFLNEPMTGIEPVTSSLPRKRSTPELHRLNWSGRRDSNSRPSAWKADALPTELLPLISLTNIRVVGRAGFEPAKLKTADLQSALVGRLSISPIIKRMSRWRDSNPRPADYKSAALAS